MLYILLAKLTDEGQRNLQSDPDAIAVAISEMKVPGVRLLARYAVLGRYDFVLMADADDIEAIAHLSVELGARAGLHFETLPATSTGSLIDEMENDARQRSGALEFEDDA